VLKNLTVLVVISRPVWGIRKGHVTTCSDSFLHRSHSIISLKQNCLQVAGIEFKLEDEQHGHRSELHLSVFSIGNIHNVIFQTSDQPGNLQLRCKTCDTPVHSHKTIPPSPTPHLLRTIQAPNATEATRLREALRLATPVVHQLDDDISHIQMLLDELRRKREPLHNFLAEQITILAPIRRIPAEILAEIFVLCMNYDISSFNPAKSPLLVGRVCKGWRQVALSTQKLWSSIHILTLIGLILTGFQVFSGSILYG
jgi:hypothetical protein